MDKISKYLYVIKFLSNFKNEPKLRLILVCIMEEKNHLNNT